MFLSRGANLCDEDEPSSTSFRTLGSNVQDSCDGRSKDRDGRVEFGWGWLGLCVLPPNWVFTTRQPCARRAKPLAIFSLQAQMRAGSRMICALGHHMTKQVNKHTTGPSQ